MYNGTFIKLKIRDRLVSRIEYFMLNPTSHCQVASGSATRHVMIV